MSSASRVALVVVAVAAVGGAFIWGQRQRSASPPPAPPVVVPPAPPPAAPSPAPVATARDPLDDATQAPKGALPSVENSDEYFKKALADLTPRKNALTFFSFDGFARRLVATVSNLATDNATADLWPVARTGGRFEIEAPPGGAAGPTVISVRNADRYAPFVHLVESIDTQRAVTLYRRVYPLLQRAYEDLGFPGQHFNDRVVEVIDHLLATPEVPGPIKVKRVVAGDAGQPSSGQGLYVFDDPALEARSSGQKILLRIGADNARRLKAKLADVRARMVQGATATRPRGP